MGKRPCLIPFHRIQQGYFGPSGGSGGGGNAPPPPPPKPPPGPKLYRESDDFRRRVAADRAAEIAAYAAALGLSVADWEHQANAHLQQLVSQMQPFTRVSTDTLEKVLTVGRFKSQFETNSSSGLLDKEARRRVEFGLFGMPFASPSHHRPIYGYLHPSPEGFDRNTAPVLNQYGRVAVRMKASVLPNLTLTGDDSLNATSPRIPGSTGMDAKTFTAFMRPNLCPEPALTPRWTAFPSCFGDVLDIADAGELYQRIGAFTDPDDSIYVEGQYHMGLSSSQIDEVTFLRGAYPPSAALVDLMTQAGIPHKVL